MADPTPPTEEQLILLSQFSNLSEVMKRRQAQVESVSKQRREVARKCRDAGVSVGDLAKAGGVGSQAVYKLLSA